MRRKSFMESCRRASWRTWLGAALAVWLLLAESFALSHQYDAASHANGQTCATCVGMASFAAGNVAVSLQFEPAAAATFVVVAVAIIALSVVPARRYARGPPRVSFMF
jgi:hypothetical protein